MIDFRKEIRAEMKRRGWSAYRLAINAGLPLRGVQAYISADRDATGERLAAMLDVLGIELKRTKKKNR